MKLILESTSKIVEINGVPARIWEGKSESGIPCHAFVTRVVVCNPSFEILSDPNGRPDSIKCLLCGSISNNPHDVTEQYCGKCHVFHDQVYAQFEQELQETRPPSAEVAAVWPLRMVL